MSLTGYGSRTSWRCEKDSNLFTGQNRKASDRYNGCDKQPDCTVVADEPGTTGGNTLNTRQWDIRNRSGQAVCRPLRLRINV